MTNLIDALSTVRDRLREFRSLYEQNEMAVRDQIINPILRSLGWNPENPKDVQPNVSTAEGVPDYSLMKGGKPILFLEAKKLSIDVEQRDAIRQLAKYAFSEGTRYGVLTNGTVWLLTRSFEEGTTLTERIVWTTDLEREEPDAVCRKLITVSKANISQIETLVKKAQILDEVWRSLLDEPDDLIKGLFPVVKEIIGEGYPNYEFEDTEIDDLLRERVERMLAGSTEEEAVSGPESEPISPAPERPRRMKLGGEVLELRNAFEILVNTGNWIIRNGRLRASDCPVAVGRGTRYLVNTDRKHRYDKEFYAPKRLSNKLWIETHSSTVQSITYARRLLEKFGFPPESLTIE